MSIHRRVLWALVVTSFCVTACRGSQNPASPATGAQPDPTDAEWLQLAAQLTAIGVDAVGQVLSSPLVTSSTLASLRPQTVSTVVPLTQLK